MLERAVDVVEVAPPASCLVIRDTAIEPSPHDLRRPCLTLIGVIEMRCQLLLGGAIQIGSRLVAPRREVANQVIPAGDSVGGRSYRIEVCPVFGERV